MRVFAAQATMAEVMGAHRKWQRMREAVALAPDLNEGVAYSIGDSLTYRTGRAEALATEFLTGRRRYHLVFACLEGRAIVEVAKKADLVVCRPYSDLSDRESFDGDAARPVELSPGGLLVVDIDEAARLLPTSDATLVQLHVTVEGSTFPNK